MAMVSVMAISRAVLVRPMAMVTRVDAECPVHPADRAADRTAGDSTKWTGGGIAFAINAAPRPAGALDTRPLEHAGGDH
jgi:hypothetical protein